MFEQKNAQHVQHLPCLARSLCLSVCLSLSLLVYRLRWLTHRWAASFVKEKSACWRTGTHTREFIAFGSLERVIRLFSLFAFQFGGSLLFGFGFTFGWPWLVSTLFFLSFCLVLPLFSTLCHSLILVDNSTQVISIDPFEILIADVGLTVGRCASPGFRIGLLFLSVSKSGYQMSYHLDFVSSIEASSIGFQQCPDWQYLKLGFQFDYWSFCYYLVSNITVKRISFVRLFFLPWISV